MSDVIVKKLDCWIAISIFFYAILIIFNYYSLLLDFGAIINLFISTLPYIITIIKIKPIITKNGLTLFLIFVIVRIMSIIANANLLTSSIIINDIYYFVSFLVAYCAIFFFIIPNVDKSCSNVIFKKTCKCILLVSVFFCVFNIIKNFNMLSQFAVSNETYDFNFSSFFSNRNNFGKLLFASNIMLLYGKKNGIISSRTFWILFILFFVNIFICLSRTAILCTIVFYLVYLLKNKKNIIYFSILLVIIVLIICFNQNLKHIVLDLLLRKENGLTGRTEIWKHAFHIIKEKPLFGHTNLNSSNLIYEYANNYYYHNSFLKIMASSGIVYLILILSVIIKKYKEIFKHKKYKEKFYFLMALFVSLILYSFAEEFVFFGTGFIDFWYSFMLFLFISICFIKKEGDF